MEKGRGLRARGLGAAGVLRRRDPGPRRRQDPEARVGRCRGGLLYTQALLRGSAHSSAGDRGNGAGQRRRPPAGPRRLAGRLPVRRGLRQVCGQPRRRRRRRAVTGGDGQLLSSCRGGEGGRGRAASFVVGLVAPHGETDCKGPLGEGPCVVVNIQIRWGKPYIIGGDRVASLCCTVGGLAVLWARLLIYTFVIGATIFFSSRVFFNSSSL
mmetsp:Transcript_12285/g.21888  ORF Transcript_12285/g.21888 Transcript_12285/m.21888 type:complete len:211 (+) Transcript_12285:146-778(+)